MLREDCFWLLVLPNFTLLLTGWTAVALFVFSVGDDIGVPNDLLISCANITSNDMIHTTSIFLVLKYILHITLILVSSNVKFKNNIKNIFSS